MIRIMTELRTPLYVQERFLKFFDTIAQKAFELGFKNEKIVSVINNKHLPELRVLPHVTLMHQRHKKPKSCGSWAGNYLRNQDFPYEDGIFEWHFRANYSDYETYFSSTMWQPWEDQPKIWIYHDVKLNFAQIQRDYPEFYLPDLSIKDPKFNEITKHFKINVKKRTINKCLSLQDFLENELKRINAKNTTVIKTEIESNDGMVHKGYEFDIRSI